MICKKTLKKFCCEDISLIENYEKAVNDKEKTWHCHHRKEDEGYTLIQLKQMGLYYQRPASELVFMDPQEHRSLHFKQKPKTSQHKKKISKSHIGKTHSEETKRKISENRKGKCIGDKNPSSRKVYQIDKNTGEIVKIWDSMRLASKTLKINSPNIWACCNYNRNEAGGFIWRYADNKKEQD